MINGKPALAIIAPFNTGEYGQMIMPVQRKMEQQFPNAIVSVFIIGGWDKNSTLKVLREVIDVDYDAVLTIGTSITFTARDYFAQVGFDKLFMYFGAGPGTEDDVDKTKQLLQNSVSINYEFGIQKNPFETFYKIKPKMKRLLVLYMIEVIPQAENSIYFSFIMNMLKQANSYLLGNGVSVCFFSACAIMDVPEILGDIANGFDSIYLMEGGRVAVLDYLLGGYCSKNKKTLFSPFFRSVQNGYSSISYVFDHSLKGDAVADLFQKYVMNSAASCPPTKIHISKQRKIFINSTIAERQDINLDHLKNLQANDASIDEIVFLDD